MTYEMLSVLQLCPCTPADACESLEQPLFWLLWRVVADLMQCALKFPDTIIPLLWSGGHNLA